MPSSCCAPGCANRLKKGSDVKMSWFPTNNPDRRDKWIRRLNHLPAPGQKSSRSDGLWDPKDHDRICSAHFVSGRFLACLKMKFVD